MPITNGELLFGIKMSTDFLVFFFFFLAKWQILTRHVQFRGHILGAQNKCGLLPSFSIKCDSNFFFF